MKSLLLVLLSLGWLGCAGAAGTASQATPSDVITVEGQATVRGNTPFTGIMLETGQRNTYVLVFDEDEKRTVQADLPARLRVTGVLYVDDWNGMPYAHLRVTAMERL